MENFLPIAALALDSVIGDPRSRLHPVVLIGNLIALLEKILLKPKLLPVQKKLAGLMLVFIVLAVTYTTAWLLVAVLNYIGPLYAFVGGALALSFTISPRSLAEAGNEIKNFMLVGDLSQARFKVGWIVGRDTNNLDTAGVTRATVETIAENIVDGIISPLFYFVIGGVPLAFLYRAANTMDSMIGYKNAKYLDFGMPAARLDDVLNYIPARITGLLVVAISSTLRYNSAGAVKAILRDAAKHPSPNSGIAEAGVAGALGVQLGGLNYYGGVESFRAHMGIPYHTLEPLHIESTIKIMYGSTILFILSITAVLNSL